MKSRNEVDRGINFAIGQVIKQRRSLLNLQQKVCAKRAYIGNSMLCRIEHGDCAVSLHDLIRLSPILKISPSDILDEALIPIVEMKENNET
jgi:transcriptional regulator with XRE-family HTH domain